MLLEENFIPLSKKEYDRNIIEDEKYIYLYHFIIFVLNDGTKVKVDTLEDLNKINYKDVKYKFHIEKIHFYNESDNFISEYGPAYHIENLGYFYIGGIVDNEIITEEEKKQLFDNYINNYNDNNFIDNDISFIKKNK